MEVRNYLEERDELGALIRDTFTGKKTGKRGGGLATIQTPEVKIGVTLQGKTSEAAAAKMASVAVKYLSDSLPTADVILWKPSVFDAAMYTRGESGGVTVDPALLPLVPQYWIPDRDEGRARVWETLERQASDDNGEPLKLVALIVGSLPFAVLSDSADGDTSAIRKMYESRGLNHAGDYSPYCSVLWVFRAKTGDKGLRFYAAHLIGGRAVAMTEHTLVPFAGLEFMASSFVSRNLVGYDRRPTRRMPFHKPSHRSQVQRLVLRERVILPFGTKAGEEDKPAKEWAHCWKTRPHTRTLNRGKENERVIQVKQSKLKGDPTKPELPPRDRLVHVSR